MFIDIANNSNYNKRDDDMGKTNVNIRMDEELKRGFGRLRSDLGLTISAAFIVFAKAVVRQRSIPFEIGMNTPGAEAVATIEKV